MEKAIKEKSGSWRIRVSYKDSDGKYKRKSITAETKKEAEFLAAQYINSKHKKHSQYTLDDVVDKYIELKSSVLSPTTIASYKGIKRNYFTSLYSRKVSDLSAADFQQEINRLSLSVSPKTVINAWGLIKAALAEYDPNQNYHVTLPKRIKQIREMPSAEDIIKVVKGTEIELPCLLALWLSLRMSEIRGLRKSDIKNGRLIIQNSIVTVDGKFVEKTATKTYESTRIHELPDYLLKLIEAVPGEYITELSGSAIYKRFSRLLEKNNIPHIRFHDLRHMNASIMLALGIQDKYAMERGGWSTTAVLKSVYQHTLSAEREKADTIINNYFNSLIE